MARVIDLSLPVKDHWRWPVRYELASDFAKGELFQSSVLSLNLHTCTHVDSPLHYVPGAASIDRTDLSSWMGEAAVVDCSHRGAEEGVTREDLERAGGHVREGDIVLIRTDWPRKCPFESKEFWTKAPYTTVGACEWLLEKKARTVGTDYPPDYVLRLRVTDPGNPRLKVREEYATHHYLLGAGVLLLEYLTNLHELRRQRVRLIALPLKLVGAEGSPVRAVAVEE